MNYQKKKNILNTLDLVDYLGLQLYSLPILKDINLVRSNPDQDENEKVKYLRASLSEARQTAAELVVGIAKNEYQMDDANTANNVFNLMNVILSTSSVFSSSFRSHTLTIVRKCCYPFFSKDQKRQLHGTHRTTLFNRRNPSTYLSGENEAIPINFANVFTWKSVHVSIDDNHANSLSSDFNDALARDIFHTFIGLDDDIGFHGICSDLSRYILQVTSNMMALENTTIEEFLRSMKYLAAPRNRDFLCDEPVCIKYLMGQCVSVSNTCSYLTTLRGEKRDEKRSVD